MLRGVDDGPEGETEVLTVGRPDEDQVCLCASVLPLAVPGGSSIRLPAKDRRTTYEQA